MKICIHLLIAITLFTSSCSYQYATVSSNGNQADNSGFVTENDSVRITYKFTGSHCPILISIYNKSDKPLYIDWKKSAVIVDAKSYSYWRDEATFDAESRSSQVRWNDVFATTTTTTTTTGTITRPESIIFIPPHAGKDASMISIKTEPFKFDPNHAVEKTRLKTPSANYLATIRYFDEEHTPFRYRSYITLSFDDSFKNSFAFEDEFWVSEVIQTSASPKAIPDKGMAANTFHIGYFPTN
ncbi:MAG TPA: hypothetical protein VGK59_03795 [Ohtaekwangia sp.]